MLTGAILSSRASYQGEACTHWPGGSVNGARAVGSYLVSYYLKILTVRVLVQVLWSNKTNRMNLLLYLERGFIRMTYRLPSS